MVFPILFVRAGLTRIEQGNHQYMGCISNLLRARIVGGHVIINYRLDRITAVFSFNDDWSHYRAAI